ncbi:hypothetical protein F8M41_023007 [Gigaspora margarita]|uniref:Uncharacterized protein n=1 Tax=Gigaspora margarita TaxID=4874 RepID=A0A8H4EHK4_GIGMA|nr:hypothetical protein F8M41_023007 [Gigaspora margarita]
MNPKGNIEVLKEIRVMSHVAIQQEHAIQREQTMNRPSIEDPILEVKAKIVELKITTNMGTNEETCTEIEIEEPEREVPNPKEQQQELIDLSAVDIEDPSQKTTIRALKC